MPETLETAAAVTPAAAPRLPRDARYYDTKREIEEFLYDEANLLDERRFQEWLGTLADDLRYFMPMEYNVKFGEHATRELTRRDQEMSWFNEGKWSVGKRVEQIMTGVHWAEEPLSRVPAGEQRAAAGDVDQRRRRTGGGRHQPLPDLPEPLRVRGVLLRG
jgi:hypothetical protein